MTENIEIERKYLLTEPNFALLLTKFTQVQTLTQTNYYFDSKEFFLQKSSVGLRIRYFHEADQAEQTLKVPIPGKKEETHHLIEITDSIGISQAKKLLQENPPVFSGQVGQYLAENFPEIELTKFAEATTTRHLLSGPDNIEITLDKTVYPDNFTDYELEVENKNSQEISTALRALKKLVDIDLSTKPTNKIVRAKAHQ